MDFVTISLSTRWRVQEIGSINALRGKKEMSVWLRVSRGRDRRQRQGSTNAREADMHLVVLLTFHIKPSQDGWQSTTEASPVTRAHNLVFSEIVAISIFLNLKEPKDCRSYGNINTDARMFTACSYFLWRIDQIPKYQHFCRDFPESWSNTRISLQKADILALGVKSQAFSRRQPYHIARLYRI